MGACGLTTDVNGNLIVKTGGGMWPYPGTPASNGTPIYCDPSSGALYGVPVPTEKFVLRQFIQALTGAGGSQVAMNAIPKIGGGTVPVDGAEHHVATAGFSITNPSATLPMDFQVQLGVDHAAIIKTSAGSGYNIFLDGQLTITGAVSVTGLQMGHQIWAMNGVTGTYDTKNAVSRYANTIPPGGTINLTVDGFVRLSSYDGSSTVSDLTYVMDFFGHN